jgi:hypothetical protein
MILAVVLSILSSRAEQPESVIQVQPPATAPAPEPVLPGAGTQTPPSGAQTPPSNPGNPGS